MEEYLFCAMEIGENLLLSGAEVSRVEDTIHRICHAYGAKQVDVFSITSSIIVTVYMNPFQSYTQTRRIASVTRNMKKLDQLNQLSRTICNDRPTAEYIHKELDKIKSQKEYPELIQIIGYSLVGGFFTLFFGGDFCDLAAGAIVGFLLQLTERTLRKYFSNSLLVCLLWSVIGGVFSRFLVLNGIGHHSDLISIGNIMLLIPGIAFTNSLKNLFIGDTITGLIRFMESLLVTITIVLGFAVAGLLL